MRHIQTFDFSQGDPNIPLTPEQVMAYHLQNIALTLNELLDVIRKKDRFHDTLIKERWISDDTVRLFRAREQIKRWFVDTGRDYMPLSRFVNQASGCRSIGYLRYPVESIKQTDFLDVEPAGNGYRVKLIREE